jgi:beta-aspartyl-peptidase (threonine type)
MSVYMLSTRLLFSLSLVIAPIFASAAPLAPLPASANYEAWHNGSLEDFTPAAPAATRGGLLLSGGGGDVETAWRWFVGCAGGGDLVVLRASGGDGYQKYLHETIGGVASVTSIKFNNASASSDSAVLARIAAAEGIFLAGGDQALYVKYWKDTPVGAALNAHIAAGKPIGGTSAGLAVLGEFYYSAMLESVTSDQTLKDSFDPNITLGSAFLTAPALAGVITDTHFMPRKRLGRLMTFLARLQIENPAAPRLVGLGVDEGTAVCVEPDATARVHTVKNGSAWLVQLLASPAATVVAGQPLEARATVIGLGPDSTLNLRTLEITAPAAVRTVHATAGRLEPAAP